MWRFFSGFYLCGISLGCGLLSRYMSSVIGMEGGGGIDEYFSQVCAWKIHEKYAEEYESFLNFLNVFCLLWSKVFVIIEEKLKFECSKNPKKLIIS